MHGAGILPGSGIQLRGMHQVRAPSCWGGLVREARTGVSGVISCETVGDLEAGLDELEREVDWKAWRRG